MSKGTPAMMLAFFTVAVTAQPARPPITGVAHMAIFVKDVEKARGFYTGVLGLHEPVTLNNPDGSLSMTFFKLNERQYVAVFPERAPETDRLNHIAIETSDVEALRQYLAAKGVAVPEAIRVGRLKTRTLNVRDPDGHTVGFVEYTPDSLLAQQNGRFTPTGVSVKLMHVGILAGSLDASLKFYRDLLGFTETWRGSRDEKKLDWVNLKVPDGEDYLELMLYTDLPAETKRGTAHHICLSVPDMDKAVQALPLDKKPEIRTGINRRRQVNLYDPDGTRTELMEPHTVDGKPAPSSAAPPPR